MASDLHDRDIREPLFEFLEDSFGKIRILEEKTMGRSRADIVMVTESGLTGIEIKSDKDTYVRLTSQIKDYDRNIIVVGSSHALHVEDVWDKDYKKGYRGILERLKIAIGDCWISFRAFKIRKIKQK